MIRLLIGTNLSPFPLCPSLGDLRSQIDHRSGHAMASSLQPESETSIHFCSSSSSTMLVYNRPELSNQSFDSDKYHDHEKKMVQNILSQKDERKDLTS